MVAHYTSTVKKKANCYGYKKANLNLLFLLSGIIIYPKWTQLLLRHYRPFFNTRSKKMKIHQFEKTQDHSDIKDIRKRKIFTVKGGRDGKEIICLCGTIWITQEGDGLDRILSSGDIYQSRIPGDIIIEGLDNSQVRISPLQKVEVIKDFCNMIPAQSACA
jgi:hypothetical protein